ncbi:uncharacterized protein G2W53_001350 [Senna tora]|uniref:Transposase MuDR plant domain-containing protein n=1 Tax=Senna tora TaxID=362788 RepID=A0A834XHD7_9FABA|nr:uncharacterized protein G2W53_001350 [Senna tora]
MTSAQKEIYELKLIIIERRAQQKEASMNKPTPLAIIPDLPSRFYAPMVGFDVFLLALWIPLNLNPLRYGKFHLEVDNDLEFVLQRHMQYSIELGLMEIYVEILRFEIKVDIGNQSSFDYTPHPILSNNPLIDKALMPSLSILPIAGRCQPLTDNPDEFTDEDEFEANVPVRNAHEEEEEEEDDDDDDDDDVGEDLFEEEAVDFYSQVEMEASQCFSGDFPAPNIDGDELYDGMKFSTKAALRKQVKLYSIKTNTTFVVVKSCSNYEDWRCPYFGKSCTWELRATQKVNTNHWEITIYPSKHTCVNTTLTQDHPKLDFDLIATCIVSMVTRELDVSVASII